ncbi:MAG: class I SAM-dependent methyltransferase, partial [Alphaproteobacteria bacterium]|nr:class I SAM-dependent methyltransferase [Alphaproteobacteria bacterium]
MTETEARQEEASHAERMDRMYRYQRHIYDLTRKYYLLGRDRAIEGLRLPSRGRLLEVGCGTGRNLLAAHRRYPEARLYGLDISAQMLASAHRHF